MRRSDLSPDCRNCSALCCVALAFDASPSFAISKDAGVRCPNLTGACRCSIHGDLAERGFGGCVAFDCYGAGQRITQAYANKTASTRESYVAFVALTSVHEQLWYLTEAAKLCPPTSSALAAQLAEAIAAGDAVAATPLSDLPGLDLAALRRSTQALLRRVGDAMSGARPPA